MDEGGKPLRTFNGQPCLIIFIVILFICLLLGLDVA